MSSEFPPLLLTRDPALVDEVARLAAAAGCEPAVAGDPVTALADWVTARVVIVGTDLADAVARVRPPGRDRVYVVGWSTAPDSAFRAALEMGAVAVAELPVSAEWLVELLTDVGEESSRGELVAVVGGTGGAGATTLACALAQVGAGRGPTLLVDADPLGPGLHRMLGLEERDGVHWEALEQTTGRLASRSLREAVPRRDALGVLTWQAAVPGTLQAFAAREVVAAGQRGHDLVVIDLPREGGALSAELSARCDLLVVVAPASVAGAAGASRLVARHPGSPAALVLRPGPVAVPDMARATGLPVLAQLPDQRRLAEAVDLGEGPVRSRRAPLARVAAQVLDGVRPRSRAA